MKNLRSHQSFLILIVISLVVLAGCDITSTSLPSGEVSTGDDTRNWISVEPGFSVALADGQISFNVDYTQFKKETFENVKPAMNNMVANNDFHRKEWLDFEAKMTDDLNLITDRWGGPEMFANHINTDSEYLETLAKGCTVSATAGPTTREPGAKAYASVSCSGEDDAREGSNVSTVAKAGNTRVPDSDDGRNGSYASSSAYDTDNTGDCYSRAEAEQQYLNFFGGTSTESKRATNDKCS